MLSIYHIGRMSIGNLPQHVDPWRLARAGTVLKGQLMLGPLERLQAVLAEPGGEATAEIVFGLDQVGYTYVHGKIKAKFSLECQRCLQAMPWLVMHEFWLSPIIHWETAKDLPLAYEPWLIESQTTKASLQTMLEDELLLCLPVIAMHDNQMCTGLIDNVEE